jgi:hypothetical protein
MKTTRPTRLALSKETLRKLDPHALRHAAGGAEAPTGSAGCSILSQICPTTDGGWGSSLCPITKR